MSRLDVFVCDRCAKQVVNEARKFGQPDTANWFMAHFEVVVGLNPDVPASLLLCPSCIRSIHEKLPEDAQ